MYVCVSVLELFRFAFLRLARKGDLFELLAEKSLPTWRACTDSGRQPTSDGRGEPARFLAAVWPARLWKETTTLLLYYIYVADLKSQ